jgi:anaerobic magnesium-protoporphyrin IX monomethyl ester cyclase
MGSRVNLINPPQLRLSEPYSYPPLGLLYVGAVLEEEGHKLAYLDLSDKEPPYKVPEADFHLITVTSATYDSARAVMRSIGDGGLKVAGGAHPTLCPEASLRELGVDAVVVGEGEPVIADVVRKRRRGIIRGGVVRDLDGLPLPARHLVPRERLINRTGVHGSSKPSTTAITSRGCPMNCHFCCRAEMYRTYRHRSPLSVTRELKALRDVYGVEHVRFVDDVFTVDREHTLRLCEAIKTLEITYMCMTRADMVDEEVLSAMKESGCTLICYGVETGSQRLLDLMGKRITTETTEKAIALTRRAGIRVRVLLMTGLPTESGRDLEETKRLLLRTRPETWTLSRWTNIPGSETWRNPEKYGVQRPGDLSDQYFYPDEEDSEYMAFKNWLRNHLGERKKW